MCANSFRKISAVENNFIKIMRTLIWKKLNISIKLLFENIVYVTYRLSKIITDVWYVKNSLMFYRGWQINMNPKKDHIWVCGTHAARPILFKFNLDQTAPIRQRKCLFLILLFMMIILNYYDFVSLWQHKNEEAIHILAGNQSIRFLK